MCVDAGKIDIKLKNENFSEFCTRIGYKTYFNVMITTLKNICVLQIYVIVMKPIFNKTYKGKKKVKIYM